ncbi:hypothetical protein F5B22DRAFT_369497 [Xylaria bambusicola]|uniref:uncharacterized protein n=1 Tax=Xylaria bambusicola TaxID=326684 RepID=UPI002008CA2B|nr:uncharacterized protein F5B22DRAFT_369497 [Xylaria bambusicola]KAI0509043.1 hypothetical protein F5B22DRAFT_369497 [Xylaria bambusicola]
MATFTSNVLQMASRRSSGGGRCSHPKLSPTVEILDPEGDMLLIVGKQICTDRACNSAGNEASNAICFHVNSIIVAGASPALGFALYSPSAVATPGNSIEWVARLPDDDPQAMHIIMNILFGDLPITPDEHVNIEQLLNLAILADKYDLTHHLTYWSAQWVQDMEPYWVGRKFVDTSTEDLESLLWIFWVLGHEPLYTYMILQIAFHSALDAAGKLTDPTGQLCFTSESREVPVPPYAPIEIGHARIEVLKMIRKDIKDTLEEHLHGRGGSVWLRCRRMDGADDGAWRQSILVAFVQMLEAEGVWPLPCAYQLTASPRSLVEIFRANPSISAFKHHHDGQFCEPDGTFWERIERLLREARFTLPAQSAIHLSEQAVKSGLASHFRSRVLAIGPDKGHWNVREILEFQEAVAAGGPVPPAWPPARS